MDMLIERQRDAAAFGSVDFGKALYSYSVQVWRHFDRRPRTVEADAKITRYIMSRNQTCALNLTISMGATHVDFQRRAVEIAKHSTAPPPPNCHLPIGALY